MSYTTLGSHHVTPSKMFWIPIASHRCRNNSALLSRKQTIKVLELSAFAFRKEQIDNRYPRCLLKTQHQHPCRQPQLPYSLPLMSPTLLTFSTANTM